MVDENSSNYPLKGKNLWIKVEELKHLSREEIAIKCGYYTEEKSLTENNYKRANLVEFYDELLKARAINEQSIESAAQERTLEEEQVSPNILTAKRIRDLYASGTRDFSSYGYSSISISDELRGEDLQRVNFSGLDFSETNLDGINLSHAILIRTDFIQSSLRNSILRGVDLTQARFSHGSICYSDLTDTNLADVDLYSAYFVGNNLTRANLTGVNLNQAWCEHHPDYDQTERNIYRDTIMPDGSIYSNI